MVINSERALCKLLPLKRDLITRKRDSQDYTSIQMEKNRCDKHSLPTFSWEFYFRHSQHTLSHHRTTRLIGKPAEQSWLRFRDTYRGHIQGIAVLPTTSPTAWVVIVAEPPPDITLEQLKAKLEPGVCWESRKWRSIGVDGRAGDAVFVVQTDLHRLSASIGALHYLMFGTNYGTSVLPSSYHLRRPPNLV